MLSLRLQAQFQSGYNSSLTDLRIDIQFIRDKRNLSKPRRMIRTGLYKRGCYRRGAQRRWQCLITKLSGGVRYTATSKFLNETGANRLCIVCALIPDVCASLRNATSKFLNETGANRLCIVCARLCTHSRPLIPDVCASLRKSKKEFLKNFQLHASSAISKFLNETDANRLAWNSIIWNRLPKSTFVMKNTLDLGIHEAIATFNDGNITKCKILSKFSISPGPMCINTMKNFDLTRIKNAEKDMLEIEKKCRKQREIAKKRLEDMYEEQEDPDNHFRSEAQTSGMSAQTIGTVGSSSKIPFFDFRSEAQTSGMSAQTIGTGFLQKF
ncbi:hypothetical protein J6590_018798 [Homalodisca vitripennis]|nr:hypothetical protein J6590_018798 [Homalodisca vitripennis]